MFVKDKPFGFKWINEWRVAIFVLNTSVGSIVKRRPNDCVVVQVKLATASTVTITRYI